MTFYTSRQLLEQASDQRMGAHGDVSKSRASIRRVALEGSPSRNDARVHPLIYETCCRGCAKIKGKPDVTEREDSPIHNVSLQLVQLS